MEHQNRASDHIGHRTGHGEDQPGKRPAPKNAEGAEDAYHADPVDGSQDAAELGGSFFFRFFLHGGSPGRGLFPGTVGRIDHQPRGCRRNQEHQADADGLSCLAAQKAIKKDGGRDADNIEGNAQSAQTLSLFGLGRHISAEEQIGRQRRQHKHQADADRLRHAAKGFREDNGNDAADIQGNGDNTAEDHVWLIGAQRLQKLVNISDTCDRRVKGRLLRLPCSHFLVKAVQGVEQDLIVQIPGLRIFRRLSKQVIDI